MKGFSLIETLLFMVVAAILLLLAIAGIQVLQRNSRDNDRIAISGEINNLINKYRREKLKYPAAADVSFQTNLFSITGLTDSIPLNGHLRSQSSTTNSQTRYYYTYVGAAEYKLCVVLETGAYKGFGTAVCP
jgi:type II secretory pathway pseudopilin PulG